MKRAPKDPEPAKHWLAFPRNHWKLSLRWTSSLFRRYQSAAKFLIFDRDGKYGIEVPAAIRSMRIQCVRTSVRSPWQNEVAERWVGSCRRDPLDQVIALDEHHLNSDSSPSMSATTARTARTLDSGRERRTAELPPWPRVAFFLRWDSEGSTTGAIGLPNPNQCSVAKTPAFPHPYIHMYSEWSLHRERWVRG
jgi:hypothetical protein